MADWMTGLLQGFSARKAEIEQQNFEEALKSRQREGLVLETLIQSPDPETRSLAIAGLLESARPGKRKSGLSGWLGQMEQSPYLERIRNLSPTVRQQVSVPDVPTQQGYIPDTPPKAQPAAQTTTNPTVQGPDGAPLSEVQPLVGATSEVIGQAPPDSPIMPDVRAMAREGAGTPPPRTMLEVERQRQTFATPADLAREKAMAVASGDVEGEVAGLIAAGYDEGEARDLVKQQYLRRTAGSQSSTPYQAVPGEYQDPNTGRWIATYATFDRRSGGWLNAQGQAITSAFRQTPRTAQHTMGIAFERAARELGFTNGSSVPPGADAEAVNARAVQLLQEESYARGTGTGQARFEAPITPSVAAQTNLPVGTRGSEIAGQRIASPAVTLARRSLQDAVNQIRTAILPKLDVLPSQREFGGTIAPGAIIAARKISRRADIAALESALSAIKANLARARGEVGAMSEPDIQRVEKSLVMLDTGLTNFFGGDNQESARARLQETLLNLDLVLKNMPAAVEIGAPPPVAATASGAGAGRTPPPSSTRTGAAAPAVPQGIWTDPATGDLYINGVKQE